MRSTHIRALPVALALAAPLPAASQTIEPPEGCTAFLTVQMKGCSVSQYWRCDAGPEGAAWEANYDADGPVSLSLYDREFQWLDSQYVATATREYLLTPAEDPASLTGLLSTGRDTYDFVIREEGPDSTRDIRHRGFDELTSRTVVIDGLELLETVFSSTASDADSGEDIYAVVGQQFVLEEERLFFLGRDTFSRDGEEATSDSAPVRFYRPGDRGFSQMTPAFGCDSPTEIGFTARLPG